MLHFGYIWVLETWFDNFYPQTSGCLNQTICPGGKKKKGEKSSWTWVDILYVLEQKWGGLWEYDQRDGTYKRLRKETDIGFLRREVNACYLRALRETAREYIFFLFHWKLSSGSYPRHDTTVIYLNAKLHKVRNIIISCLHYLQSETDHF